MDTATETKTVAGEISTQLKAENKILEHVWWLKKNGRSESTIVSRVKILKTLVKRGANLNDPETIKDVIAKTNMECRQKKQRFRCLLSIPKNDGGQMGKTTIQNGSQATFYSKRDRN